MSDQPQPKPITDLSTRVVSLAREIDRLPAGTYTLALVKPEVVGMSWHVEIVRVEPVRVMELTKRENGT